jgi:hypothetical protein
MTWKHPPGASCWMTTATRRQRRTSRRSSACLVPTPPLARRSRRWFPGSHARLRRQATGS